MRAIGVGHHVKITERIDLRAERFRRSREEVLAQAAELGLPVFVKPAHLGSSVGIVKVSAAEALGAALEQAFVHDSLAIVEAMASGTEVECGVLGARAGEVDQASEPGEIVFAGEFYDYAAKYLPGGMELMIPARISASARAEVARLALAAFHAAGCEGLARVDFFVDGASSPGGQVIAYSKCKQGSAEQVGQIPADYTQGAGTLASGATADKATEAALAAYPGGIVVRVVELSNGDYEVHYIGVNWPHHIFVNQDFQVIGANS